MASQISDGVIQITNTLVMIQLSRGLHNGGVCSGGCLICDFLAVGNDAMRTRHAKGFTIDAEKPSKRRSRKAPAHYIHRSSMGKCLFICAEFCRSWICKDCGMTKRSCDGDKCEWPANSSYLLDFGGTELICRKSQNGDLCVCICSPVNSSTECNRVSRTKEVFTKFVTNLVPLHSNLGVKWKEFPNLFCDRWRFRMNPQRRSRNDLSSNSM